MKVTLVKSGYFEKLAVVNVSIKDLTVLEDIAFLNVLWPEDNKRQVYITIKKEEAKELLERFSSESD